MRTLVLLAIAALSSAQSQHRDRMLESPQLLWHAPRVMTVRDWVCGPGGCDRTPVPPFHFVKEDRGGTAPKVTVRDARGRMWSAKFGAEVIPECFGSRFVSALGYVAEPTYYVEKGRLDDASKARRTRHVVKPDGSFRRARFELRGDKDFEFLQGQTWSWVDNPFVGTHELAGLKIVMMLLSNWDAKDSRDGDESNNNVFRGVVDGRPALLFCTYDWGASLGQWGSVFRRDQSDCSGYVRDTPRFIRGVHGNQVEFGFVGKHGDDLNRGITVEDVRWLLPYLLRITPGQLRAGLEASGAADRQTACWAAAIEHRIQQLQAVAK